MEKKIAPTFCLFNQNDERICLENIRVKKKISVILILTSLLWLVISLPPSVQGALIEEDIPLTVNWSADSYYQGDSGSLTISIEHNAGGSKVYILALSISFWPEGISLHSQEEPRIHLPANGSHTFGPAFFTVPPNAPVGWSKLSVKVTYQKISISHPAPGLPGFELVVTGFFTVEPAQQINIKENPHYEQTYREVLAEFLNQLSNADKTDFECPEAKSLYRDASNEHFSAVLFEFDEKWIDATTCLETASDFLTQAFSMEKEYQINKWRKEASDSIDAANNKITEITEWQSADAESLWQQAQTELLTSQNYFNQETLQSYQNAHDSALQASSYAEQAYSEEQTYLLKKEEQQDYFVVGVLGVFLIIIIIIVILALRKKRKLRHKN